MLLTNAIYLVSHKYYKCSDVKVNTHQTPNNPKDYLEIQKSKWKIIEFMLDTDITINSLLKFYTYFEMQIKPWTMNNLC